jgi:hypothetical protein
MYPGLPLSHEARKRQELFLTTASLSCESTLISGFDMCLDLHSGDSFL